MQNGQGILLRSSLLTKEIRAGSPIKVELVLQNNSDSSFVVNKRMAIGYKSSLSRELYVELKFENDGENLPYYESDINRDFSPKSDYVSLAPGEKLSRIIDLYEFYTPKGPGNYQAIIYYQADEELASLPKNVLKGTYKSDPVYFGVLPELEGAE